jgi:hypothetical protein
MKININKYGLRFCRGVTVLLLLISIIFRIKELVFFTFIIMLIPAVFSFKFSPFYMLFTATLGKFIPVKNEEIDTSEVRFAQGFGAFLLLIGLFYLYYKHSVTAGWIYAGSVAAATAFGTAGLCVGALMFRFFKKTFRSLFKMKAGTENHDK